MVKTRDLKLEANRTLGVTLLADQFDGQIRNTVREMQRVHLRLPWLPKGTFREQSCDQTILRITVEKYSSLEEMILWSNDSCLTVEEHSSLAEKEVNEDRTSEM